MVTRTINLPFKRNSVFLFGPRQVGKSTLIRQLLANEEHFEINLLKSDVFLKYKTSPNRLRAECEFFDHRPGYRRKQQDYKGLLPDSGRHAYRRKIGYFAYHMI